jgi:putative tryptophan/tyrosine transport system substrate-binding protein
LKEKKIAFIWELAAIFILKIRSMKKWIGSFGMLLAICIGLLLVIPGCQQRAKNVPTIGFADAFADNTIEQAKQGFIDALKKNGFDEQKGTVNIIYRNAQGNIPVLTQIIQYFISQKVTLIAANPSLSTITAIQNTRDIPVFMMVSPTPAMMKVTDEQGAAPKNLFGVADEQDYIDTSFALINTLVKPKAGQLSVGMIFNQSEPQSVEALERIRRLAEKLHINVVSLPVNSTADVQLVTQSLLSRNIDAFFANPDNTVFGSFETIIKACNAAKVPVFTSEAGLVARGAVAAYGADIYQWGYQAGEQAAQYLAAKSTEGLHWEKVKLRKRVYDPEAAKQFGITVPADFQAIPPSK